ncbi:hypothetical protein Calab_0978 [Caldithrix abyssi DSM 13497]|uniref:Uncharacterized protein n=1 Tax=Caldithrix abyssi DSM 13497 TaxID=880073 RepID=H1XVA6_CALAY|nr:hypothetical protein [Caldithrix abyssi]APF20934.1 hypothetical protein Cabys_4189 [Caldithrix abyssi DSM 13497]EHO40612.1 hypothetical protein Calab_0978 [Caldithrix abyssi DSM 13497]
MNEQALQKRFEDLQMRLRILILQNRSETLEYDEEFLRQIHDISARLLRLKKRLSASSEAENALWEIRKRLTGV